MNIKGLCGQVGECQRLCVRAEYCPLGQARAHKLLGAYRVRRQLRRLVVGRAIEANIRQAAGSFQAFQLRLAWERQQKAQEKEVCNVRPSLITTASNLNPAQRGHGGVRGLPQRSRFVMQRIIGEVHKSLGNKLVLCITTEKVEHMTISSSSVGGQEVTIFDLPLDSIFDLAQGILSSAWAQIEKSDNEEVSPANEDSQAAYELTKF